MFKKLTYSLFTRICVALFMLLNLIVVSRYLGSEVLGQISLIILNVAIIQAVAEIYSGSALVHFIPRTSFTRIYLTGVGWIGLCIFTLYAFYLVAGILRPEILKKMLGDTDFKWHVLTLSFLTSIYSFHNLLLLGKEKISSYNFLVFFQPALMVFILVINVFMFHINSVYASLVAYYVSFFVSLALSALFIYNTRQVGEGNEFPVAAIFRNGFYNQVGNLAHMLSNRFNYYVIGGLGFSLVGVYTGATSLIESILLVSASVSPLVLTRIANQGPDKENSHVSLFLAKLCLILSLFCVLIVLILPAEFFEYLLGKDFLATRTIMLYLSPGVLCLSFSSILSHYFSGLGKQKILLVANVSGLIVTLALSYFMVHHYGLVGAAITASLAYFVQAAVITAIFISENKMSAKEIFSFKTEFLKLRERT